MTDINALQRVLARLEDMGGTEQYPPSVTLPGDELAALVDDYNDEMAAHAGALCEMGDTQLALVLLANQLETYCIPFVPAAEEATFKARIACDTARRLEVAGQKVLDGILAK